MTFRTYLALMAVATLLSAFAWTVVVWSTDPYQAGVTGFLMFYFTLFLALVGALTIIGTLYRIVLLKRNDVVSREVKISFRHAVALSVSGVTALLLSAQGRFHWWTLLVLIVVMTVV